MPTPGIAAVAIALTTSRCERRDGRPPMTPRGMNGSRASRASGTDTRHPTCRVSPTMSPQNAAQPNSRREEGKKAAPAAHKKNDPAVEEPQKKAKGYGAARPCAQSAP